MFRLLILLLFCVSLVKSSAQSVFDTLHRVAREPVDIQLTFDMRELMKNLDEEPWLKTDLVLVSQPGDTLRAPVKVRARGNSRKNICSPPPLKLKIKKNLLASVGLDTAYNDFKLVMQCKDAKSFPDYLYREYMAYRLYSMLTDYSFKVHLVNLTIIDSEDPDRVLERKGFIIENEEQLAARLGGFIRERPVKYADPLEDQCYLRFCLFQYMIGNTDWALGNTHNVKMVERPKMGDVLLVPYDFDYSGFVHTPYAVPDERLPIQSVKQRYYKGMHPEEELLAAEVAYWKEKMPAMRSFLTDFPHLDNRHRKEILKYFDNFEKIITKPKRIRRLVR